MIRLFPYGFLIAKEGFINGRPGFETVQLPFGYQMSKRKEVELNLATSDHTAVLVIGVCYFVDDEVNCFSSPAQRLLDALNRSDEEFYGLLDVVAGRFVIAIFQQDGELKIFNDPLGMQNVYVDAKNGFIASHSKFIRSVRSELGIAQQECDAPSQYYFWNETEDPDVEALVPNFYFSFDTGTQHRYYPRQLNRFSHLSDDEKASLGADLAAKSVRKLRSFGWRIACALTAGYDCRTVAAALLSEGVSVEFVTYGTKQAIKNKSNNETLYTYSQDVEVASRIAGDLNLNYRVIDLENGDGFQLTAEEKQILDANTFLRHGRQFQKQYERLFGNDRVIMAVGAGLETFIDYYSTGSRALSPKEDWKEAIIAVAGLNTIPKTELGAQLDKLWEKGQYKKIENFGFSLSNLILWEQRCGRFQSEAINAQLSAFLPINPLGIRTLFEIGQGLDLDLRKQHHFQVQLIGRLFGALLGYPFNADKTLPEIAQRAGSYRSKIAVKSDQLSIFRDSTTRSHSETRFTVPGTLALTEDCLSEGCCVYFEHVYFLSQGSIYLSLENDYSRDLRVGTVDIFVQVNGERIWRQDIGWESTKLELGVHGLQRGDLIQVGVCANETLGRSWIAPSQLRLREFRPVPRKVIQPLKCVSNSANDEQIQEDELGEINGEIGN